jgi:hypothetical protein
MLVIFLFFRVERTDHGIQILIIRMYVYPIGQSYKQCQIMWTTIFVNTRFRAFLKSYTERIRTIFLFCEDIICTAVYKCLESVNIARQSCAP